MQIYNTTFPHKSLIHETWYLCDADITAYPLKDVLRRINISLEELIGEIINADGTWQYDDTNYTDLPRGKATLVEGQESYSFTAEYLQIEAIEILDTDSVYKRIRPLDHAELDGASPQEYYGVKSNGNPNTGFPETFDTLGDTIFLYPAPTSSSVTLTNGLRVWFKRTGKLYTMSDSTTITSGEESVEPGLPSPYHIILAYMAAIPYCMAYKKDRVALYQGKGNDLKKNLLAFYGRREKNKVKRASMRPILFR